MQSRYYNPELGRFINSDVYASTGQGFFGINTFVYCNNNPIGLVDHGGDIPLALGIGVAIVASVMAAVVAHHAAKNGAKQIAKAVSSIKIPSPKEVATRIVAGSIVRAAKQAADIYEYSKSIAIAVTNQMKRTPHVHHIVPVGKFSHRSASTINKINEMHDKLNSVGINRFFDPMNLMVVSAETHARLHTDAYIDHVHSYIMSAGDDKMEVYGMMFQLRIEIAAQDIFASGF